MFIGEILDLANQTVVPPFSALLLFGSYARGDQDASSDIDLLQVTQTRTKSYANGKVNVTCYTPDQLISLARNGSMFARHIVLEAVALIDPDEFLQVLKSEYMPPDDYVKSYQDVKCALPLVAITEEVFEQNAHYYSATASYLLRSYVYARAFAQGVSTFSMRDVARQTSDPRPVERLKDLRLNERYLQFRRVVDLLFELTGEEKAYRAESLEAFILNSYAKCELAVILGLRILARGDLMNYVFIRSRT